MKARDRILLMCIPPLIGLLLVGGFLTASKFSQWMEARSVRTQVANVDKMTSLVHQLQVERGQSVGFVASQGVNFAGSIESVRRATDAAVVGVSGTDVKITQKVRELFGIRERVMSNSISPEEVATLYTGIVRLLIDEANRRIFEQSNPDISKLSAGVVALGEAKEAAGLQRASGAAGFGSGRFSREGYQTFISRGGFETGNILTALHALEGMFTANDFRQGQIASGVGELREFVSQAGADTDVSGFSASVWFERSTRWIDELRSIEQAVFSEMSVVAAQQQKDAAVVLALVLFLIVAVLASSGAAILRTLTTTSNEQQYMEARLKALGDGSYASLQRDVSVSVEVAQLFRAMDATWSQLVGANEQIASNAREVERTSQERQRVMERIDVALSKLSSGDLNSPIGDVFPEQFEQLRKSYNFALRKLNDAFQEIDDCSEFVKNSSSKLSTFNNQLTQRTVSQAAALEETTAALVQMTKNVEGTAQSTGQANDMASKLQAEALNGRKQIEIAVEVIEDIERSTAQMSHMVSMIEEMAFQTNLLALNSGVEAARAGEHGKGFAVVAQEVRNLAGKATETTNEIKQQIQEAMSKTANGVTQAQAAGQAFAAIEESLRHSGELLDRIASEATEQSTGIREIQSAMVEVDRATQENAALVDQSNQVSEELDTTAQDLSASVKKFHVSEADAPNLAHSAWG
ncbi:methyl-accepting chemotaxis protein [Roseobacteraceae bacterium S113]